jgi:hypothetical protein
MHLLPRAPATECMGEPTEGCEAGVLGPPVIAYERRASLARENGAGGQPQAVISRRKLYGSPC